MIDDFTVMSAPKLTDYKYIIFDVYGTLADWETGIYEGLKPLLSRFPSVSRWSRGDALQAFLSVESDLQTQYPSLLYSNLLAKVHEVLEARLAAAEADLDLDGPSTVTSIATRSTSSAPSNAHTAFGQSIKHWAPFPDSSQALHDLSTHFKLIVLSNVDHLSFAYTHGYLSEGISPPANIQQSSPIYSRPSPNPHPHDLWLPQQTPDSKSPFSLVMTAQDTGAYKPALEGFNMVFETIRTEPSLLGSFLAEGNAPPTIGDIKSRALIVAQSLQHDHGPARRLGVRSVWIDRQGAAFRPDDGGKDAGWGWRFETLGDMAQAVEQELLGS